MKNITQMLEELAKARPFNLVVCQAENGLIYTIKEIVHEEESETTFIKIEEF